MPTITLCFFEIKSEAVLLIFSMPVPPPLWSWIQTDQPLEGLPAGRWEVERDGETLPPRLFLKLFTCLRCHYTHRETASDADKHNWQNAKAVWLQLLHCCFTTKLRGKSQSIKYVHIHNSSVYMQGCHGKLPVTKETTTKKISQHFK